MKKYLFIVLLVGVWSCEEEPKDCMGVAGGSAVEDSCGVCDDDPSNDCVEDCSGIFGGNNICGCTDSLATNFDATATFDDESCQYDTSPPSVNITTPFGSTVSEIVSITVMVNDDFGIDKVELWVDGTNTNIIDDTEPYELKWNTSALNNNSSHIIIVRVYDTSGNITDSESRTLVVDNSSAIPANVDVSYSYSSNSFNITWKKNNDTDFSSYTLYESEVDDQSIGTQIYQTDDQNDTTYTVSNVETGIVYHYWITVKDTVGLMNTSSSLTAVYYADGFILENESGTEVYREFEGAVTGSVTLSVGDTLDLAVHFLDHEGNEIEHEEEGDEDHEGGLSISEYDPSIAFVEAEDHDNDHEEHGIAIHVFGVSSGFTSFKLQLVHEGHAYYTSTNSVSVVVY